MDDGEEDDGEGSNDNGSDGVVALSELLLLLELSAVSVLFLLEWGQAGH